MIWRSSLQISYVISKLSVFWLQLHLMIMDNLYWWSAYTHTTMWSILHATSHKILTTTLWGKYSEWSTGHWYRNRGSKRSHLPEVTKAVNGTGGILICISVWLKDYKIITLVSLGLLLFFFKEKKSLLNNLFNASYLALSISIFLLFLLKYSWCTILYWFQVYNTAYTHY